MTFKLPNELAGRVYRYNDVLDCIEALTKEAAELKELIVNDENYSSYVEDIDRASVEESIFEFKHKKIGKREVEVVQEEVIVPE